MRNESIIKLFKIVKENKETPYKYIPYKDQLKMKEWSYFRLYLLFIRDFKCELCGFNIVKYLHIHHKKYKRNKFAWQYENEEVIVLCKHCHKKVHMPELREKHNRTKQIKNIIDVKGTSIL